MPEFKDRLKSLRQSANLTQSELADKLKVSASTISMYEVGERKPSFEVLEQIADFFNVDTDYLRGKSLHSTYYLDPSVAKQAQQLRDNPGQRLLLDATQDLSQADIDFLLAVIDNLKSRRRQ